MQDQFHPFIERSYCLLTSLAIVFLEEQGIRPYRRGLILDIHPPNPPGDRIKEELQDRGWSQSDLAIILKRPIQVVNEIISGKRGITPETAIQLGAAFGTDPDVWLRSESQYRLFFVEVPIEDVSPRARLFSLAPLKELQRRGWISSGDDLSLIERDLLDLFEIEDLSQEPSLQAMMRKFIRTRN